MDFNKFNNKLIVFEGSDSTGKSSVADLFNKDLRAAGIKTVHTQQPGGDWGPLAPFIRSLCKDKRFELGNYANLFAFLLDRSECMEKIVKPALDSGKTVICDRWSYSTVAYQLHGKGMLDDFKFFLKEDSKVEAVKEWIECSFFNIQPDFTFYFPTKVGERESNPSDNFESRGSVFEKRVKEAYEELSEKLDWFEIQPGLNIKETLTNLYNKLEIRDELL
jgi:dTMP kinase